MNTKKRKIRLGAISEMLTDAGISFAEFTPGEQKCISAKIPKLLDEGKPQDQAIAIAISTCAPGKAKKKSSRAAKLDETGRLPGGRYRAVENSNGTFSIFNVPIFAEHSIPGDEITIDRAWMQRALDRASQRLEDDAYLPPLHIRHHGMGQETVASGKFRLTTLRRARYQGEALWVLFADLLNIPNEIFQKIQEGGLSYRSVEIHDLDNPEIDSLALLDDEVPFFRFPLLTVDVQEVGAVQRMQDRQPMLAYRALGHGATSLFNFSEIQYKEKDMPGHEDEKKKEEKMNVEEETDVSLNDIMDMLQELMKVLVKEEDTEDTAAGDEGEAMDTKPVDLAASDTGEASVELLASLDATAQRVEKLEREREIEKEIAAVKEDLMSYGLDPKKLDERMREVSKDYGVKGIRLYAASVKENVTPDPSPQWGGEVVLDESVPECVQEFTKYGAEALEKALKYSREYDSFRGNLRQDRKTFIADSLTADGLIK